jgi:hypothetical protein
MTPRANKIRSNLNKVKSRRQQIAQFSSDIEKIKSIIVRKTSLLKVNTKIAEKIKSDEDAYYTWLLSPIFGSVRLYVESAGMFSVVLSNTKFENGARTISPDFLKDYNIGNGGKIPLLLRLWVGDTEYGFQSGEAFCGIDVANQEWILAFRGKIFRLKVNINSNLFPLTGWINQDNPEETFSFGPHDHDIQQVNTLINVFANTSPFGYPSDFVDIDSVFKNSNFKFEIIDSTFSSDSRTKHINTNAVLNSHYGEGGDFYQVKSALFNSENGDPNNSKVIIFNNSQYLFNAFTSTIAKNPLFIKYSKPFSISTDGTSATCAGERCTRRKLWQILDLEKNVFYYNFNYNGDSLFPVKGWVRADKLKSSVDSNNFVSFNITFTSESGSGSGSGDGGIGLELIDQLNNILNIALT